MAEVAGAVHRRRCADAELALHAVTTTQGGAERAGEVVGQGASIASDREPGAEARICPSRPRKSRPGALGRAALRRD